MHETRHAPLNASTVDLYGRALRHAALAVLLGAASPTSVAGVLAGIERMGRRVDAPYPAKALADALRYEVRMGRVRRVSRGMRHRVLSRFGAPVAS